MKTTITYGHTTCRIEQGTLTPEAQNALSEALSYEVAGAEHMKRSGKFGNARYGGKEWDGKKRLYHKGHRTFGTGLLSRVLEILEEHGYDVHVTDKNIAAREVSHYYLRQPGQEWELRKYQADAVGSAVVYERGMIKVATGGGKTVIAGHIISKLSTDTVFLVHTKDLLYQAYDTFVSMFGKDSVGIVGDGKVEPNTITVCTVQTAARSLGVDYVSGDEDDTWKDKDTPDSDISRVLQNAGCVMVDECHRVAAPTATDVLAAIRNAPYRFGFSASPWRDDGADIALEAALGDILVDINASTLIDMGYLVKPIIRMRQTPIGRFPKGTKYSTVYEQFIIENEQRNKMIVDDALSKTRRGLRTLVLVRNIKHGIDLQNKLNDMLGGAVPFLSGKDDSDTRNRVIQQMRDDKLPLLVATTIADEGLDIKPLAGLVLAGAGKSSTRALQRIGRVLRPYPGKRIAEVTDFYDNAKYLLDHSDARVKMYESEPNFVVTDI
jgi:superfamily II DNA or RNA helicase